MITNALLIIKPCVAIRLVRTHHVDIRDKELQPGPWQPGAVDCEANMLIAVPSPFNGLIVVASTTISYLNGNGNTQCIEIQNTEMCTFERINKEGTRYLLGDCRGVLMVLVLCTDPAQPAAVKALLTDYLGVTSIPETISFFNQGVVFVGSLFGDSQLVKLLAEKDEHGSCVEVLEVYPSTGPILDMCLVESEKSGGQRQLVTCSGAYKDGSLRIIRSGIGLQEQASDSYFA